MIVKDAILQILEESLEESGDIVDLSLDPIEDLHMDSVQLMLFVLGLEDKFNVEISEFAEISSHMGTISELVNYLMEFIENKRER